MDPAVAAEGVQVTERWAGRLSTLLRSNSMNANASAANAEIQSSLAAPAAAAAYTASTADAGSSETAAASAATGTSAQAAPETHNPFSQYYAQIIHQQNMLQDSVRTGIYQRAVLENADDFRLVANALSCREDFATIASRARGFSISIASTEHLH
jgi:hypothetical protein